MARFILGPILAVILLMVVSWTVGEYLRQRSDRNRRSTRKKN